MRIPPRPTNVGRGLLRIKDETSEVVLYMQIHHRGSFAKKAVDTRRMTRRNRLSREARYRRSKFSDGGRFEPPSGGMDSAQREKYG